MAWRDAVFGGNPLGFEQGEFGQAHEDRVKRAGFEARFAAEFVAVAPRRGALDEAFENAEGLRRQAGSLHSLKSTYVDFIVKREFSACFAERRNSSLSGRMRQGKPTDS